MFRDGSIGDVFGRGSGLTAHVNPLLPMLAGYLYRLFGWVSPAAETILTVIAISCIFGAALIFYDSFRRLGVSRNARLAGLALYCLLPLNLRLEMVNFRIWEGGLAVLLLSIGFRQLVILDGRSDVRLADSARFALIAAAALFVNPGAGVALYAAALVFMIRNMRLQQALATTAVASAILIAVLAPWTIRNAVAFDRFIPLRSNFGLEMALANHPGVLTGEDEGRIFTKRLDEIHPHGSQTAFDRMQRSGGEQAYAQQLGKEAWAWMRAHPGTTVKLALKHGAEFYFPPAWQFNLWGADGRGTSIKTGLMALLTALGLGGGALLAFGIGGRWVYPLVFLTAPALPYLLVQPTARYHYLIHTLALFVAVGAFDRFWRRSALRPAGRR